MKRIISFILSLALVLSMFVTSVISVSAADGTTSTGLEYTINDDGSTVTISDYTGTDTEVVIPDSIEGMAVTCIGNAAFSTCRSLTNIEIPASVTSIANYAFDDCTSLTSITVDEGNTKYSSVDGVLFDKTKEILIKYPAGREGSYIVPDGVVGFASGTFDDCSKLTSIDIPASVRSMMYDFNDCTSLTSINVDESNEKYSSVDGILFDKEKTRLMKYPAGKTDGSYTVPDGVTIIDWYAFFGCESLTSIIIPASVTGIGASAFNGCINLEQVVYSGTEAQWKAIFIEEDNDPLLDAEIIFSVTGVAGDLNGDETINTKDLTRLMKFIAGDDVTANGADVTGDGKVDTKDLTRLMRYLAGEKVELA